MKALSVKTVFFVFRFLSFSVILCLLIPLFALLPSTSPITSETISENVSPSVAVIIDPGHGGIDCGAVGYNGVLEKDLNLSISSILSALCKANGINAIMTREEDKMLDLENDSLSGTHKMRDLKNRLAIAEKHPNALFISIHMNKFSQSQYSGLQVWYTENNSESSDLAKKIQDKVKENLLNGNERKPKAADSSIFLLNRAVGTAVLIECGFLSNPQEAEALADKSYQQQLAVIIFSAISEYLNDSARTYNTDT